MTSYHSDYLSLSETLTQLNIGRNNFCRAIEEGKIRIPAYLRSGHQPFLADFLSGLSHVSDKDQMNEEVAGHLNRDQNNGGTRLLAHLLDVSRHRGEWGRCHNLRSKLYMLKPWEGWFIAFPHQPLSDDWRNIAGVDGSECIIHPEHLGDADVTIEGVLIDHVQPAGQIDNEFPHFALFGIVRLTPDTLIRWARCGRFISPVRVTPPSWWNAVSRLVLWRKEGFPKNYFALRYPTTEGYSDTPPSELSLAPRGGWHSAPTDDDLLFRTQDVEALRIEKTSAESSPIVRKPISVAKQNEASILDALRDLGFNPLAIPLSNGMDGAKKIALEHRLCRHLTTSQFKDAWKRLRKDGRIKDALV